VVFFLAFLVELQLAVISSPLLYRLSVAKEVAASPTAAGGGKREGAVCAAVDKIEGMRKPKDFVGYRKRSDGLLIRRSLVRVQQVEPKITDTRLGIWYFSCQMMTRTHSSGSVRWTLPATSANTGCYYNFALTEQNAYRVQQGEPKNPSLRTWIFSFVPKGITSFDRRSISFRETRNIISNLFGTNERCCAVGANDVLRNDVGLRPMMLRFAREVCLRHVIRNTSHHCDHIKRPSVQIFILAFLNGYTCLETSRIAS